MIKRMASYGAILFYFNRLGDKKSIYSKVVQIPIILFVELLKRGI